MNQSADPNTVEPTGRVRALVEEVIAGTDVFVVDIDVRGSGGSRVVDVYVDSDENLDVQRLADINRQVGFLLEMEDVIPGRYNLNVSSPGLDRPLRMPRQYRKNIGRRVRVHFQKPDGSGATEVEGELIGVNDDTIELDADGDVRSISFEDVVWAKIRLPW